MKEYVGRSFDEERAFYGCRGVRLINCAIAGERDGESAFKECRNVETQKCLFELRYPFWHDKGVKISDCTMSEGCRAALWYSRGIALENTVMHGVKALRECADADMSGCEIRSPEFGWFSRGVKMKNCRVESEYFFLKARRLELEGVDFTGKYSFQYVRDAHLRNCTLSTKDAFWHSVNVTVENCLVKGEYLGWYAQNLTFINCRIEGTQPLCYCKGVKLIDCQMINTDLCFEKSDVSARLTTPVLSIKNPRSGEIFAPAVGEVIRDDPASCCRIVTQG